ncbi:hypothetical protein ACFYXH_01375 [Streptomyces sp. NPDC002730]|uniref:hypothetical protein n=1 Tax=Streptomyces sp. NPDC002730 TaxID=3364662 RepID=UPI0036842657
MPSRTLPPPPPPEEIRAWPDREALLTDRAGAMGELSRRSIRVSRLLLLWLTVAGFAAGWGLVGAALQTFTEPLDPFDVLFGAIFLGVGLAFMVPTGIVIGFGIRHDGQVRARLRQWSSLDRDPVRDARYRSPGESLCWFVPSFLLCAVGLWLCFAVPAGAKQGQETYGEVILLMGMGFILWLTGLLGIAKAVSHYRWAVRLAAVVPARVGGGAHR